MLPGILIKIGKWLERAVLYARPRDVIIVRTFLSLVRIFARPLLVDLIILICKSLTCTSRNVVYFAHCVTCNLKLQGVGSTVNFKSRLANYKSHIRYNKRTCSVVNHFIDVHGGDHSSLKFD